MQDFVIMEDGTELFVGDKVVIGSSDGLTVGEIEEISGDPDDCIGMTTGGWFGVSGAMNIGGWKILRKATEEDVANLPEY